MTGVLSGTKLRYYTFRGRKATGSYLDIGEDDHRQDHHKGHSPHGCAHHLGHTGVSPLGAADWMNYSQVAIDGHDSQTENRRELVHRVCSHDQAAQEGTKGPVGEHVLCGEERKPDDVELIGHSQVQDVDVGDCLHFGITQHNIDGQSVASQTNYED